MRILRVSFPIAILALLSACDSAQSPASSPASQSARPASNNDTPAMTNPKAIIIVWTGPSDRPTPPTIVWSDAHALKSAESWLAARPNSLPLAASSVQTTPEAIACAARSIGAASTGASFIQVTPWDGSSAGASVRLDASGSRQFIDASIECVGQKSPAAGLFRSLRTMVDQAAK